MGKFRKIKPVTAFFVLLSVFSSTLCGCISIVKDQKKLNDIDFEVVAREKIPKELKEAIKKSKGGKFSLTYVDKGKMYIARGYGEKEKSGYSVSVEALYETKDHICIRTKLIGPKKGEKIKKAATCPYVVVVFDKIEKKDRKDVVFK